jgi:type II secretory pathway pseudopilin PulG
MILIAAIGPSIAAIVQRDKETELIFRGRQYARGIVAFQRRFGRLPTSLKELAKSQPRTLRQLWKEPMCNCDGWQVIIAGTPDAVPPGQAPPGFPGTRPGTTPLPGNQPPSTYSGMFPPKTPPPSAGGGGAQPTPGFPSLFGAPETQTIGPIVGVRSKVHKKGYRKWRDLEYYDEWRFIAGNADGDTGPNFDPNSLRGVNRPTPRPDL